MKLLILFLQYFFVESLRLNGEVKNYSLKVLYGGRVSLLCNVPYTNYGLSYVKWFKEDQNNVLLVGTVIRNRQWSRSEISPEYRGRCFMQDSHMVLEKLTVDDEGFYFCRLVYGSTTSTLPNNYNPDLRYGGGRSIRKHHLLVLKPPRDPVIDLRETSSAFGKADAVCISIGGRPGANLSWYEGDKKLESRVYNYIRTKRENPELTTSTSYLFLSSRPESARTFTCVAEHESYHGVTKKATVTLEKHVYMNIVDFDNREFRCESTIDPNATFDWYLGNQQVAENTATYRLKIPYKSIPANTNIYCNTTNNDVRGKNDYKLIDNLKNARLFFKKCLVPNRKTRAFLAGHCKLDERNIGPEKKNVIPNYSSAVGIRCRNLNTGSISFRCCTGCWNIMTGTYLAGFKVKPSYVETAYEKNGKREVIIKMPMCCECFPSL